MEISVSKIKLLFREPVFILLILNMLWVIIGYALGTTQGEGVVAVMRVFKTVFVFFSFIYVIYINGFSTQFIFNSLSIYIVVVAVSLFSFFADNPFRALYKGLTFVYPLLYIMYTINYLLRYGATNLLVAFSLAILQVYAIVPLSFYLVGGSLENEIIYGYNEGNYFVSNHYGWGSTLFILSALTILRFYPLKIYYKIAIYIFIPLAFYLLIISANRSGILSIAIAFVLYFLKDKYTSVSGKMFLLIVSFLILIFISFQENSVLEFLQEKNQTQFETGAEGRLIGTNAMLQSFSKKPVYWFTGVGMFNYTELKLNGGVLGAYHNSYWEILFGSGIIVFIFFLKFMLFQPLKIFWRSTLSHSLLVIPLLLIPFFESDLTAGQFLFFPWFGYMILLNAKEFGFYSKNKNVLMNG